MNGRSWGVIALVVMLGLGLHQGVTFLSHRLMGRFSQSTALQSEQKLTEITSFSKEVTTEANRPIPQDDPHLFSPSLSVPESGRSLFLTPPPSLRSAVDFWRQIYAVYDFNQTVLHDSGDLSVIYGVLDFSSWDQQGLSEFEKEKAREKLIQAEIKRIGEDLPLEAAERVRAQRGLKDKFGNAVKVSGKYLPLFEEIFEYYDIPMELTRLVFVESLFQERAQSKVGAVGLWQFMPGTARRYLQVGHLIDERYDPILATHAAARLLKSNYEVLGEWPLAVTAYNAGVGTMQKAVSATGTTDLGTIIREYRGGVFGFASRNFYPSFLAAVEVFHHADQYLGFIQREEPLLFDFVALPARASFPQIAFWSGSNLKELSRLNPSYVREVARGVYLLPSGAKIRLPYGRSDVFKTRFMQYPSVPADLALDYASIQTEIP
ncbi:MAG: lytic transglycosylase domain-containing protein [Deltaproteobacteria bacterium]|nr:lytic transglycosylase domain-containing protein [Deltaproteobacteria bacterium]MBI2500661.1 lytic transglycosylase domain-containing protein [Deltaproteobacteria bacterium]